MRGEVCEVRCAGRGGGEERGAVTGAVLEALDDGGLAAAVLAEDEGERRVELDVLPVLVARPEGSDALHLEKGCTQVQAAGCRVLYAGSAGRAGPPWSRAAPVASLSGPWCPASLGFPNLPRLPSAESRQYRALKPRFVDIRS